MARLTFDILAHAWRKRDVLLVDLKIEFGRLTGGENKGQLVIADVIDNDSWRIWPQGREDLMLDKQMYRNLRDVDDEALARVKRAYERVAELVGTFPVMRPGMAAVIADSNGAGRRANEIVAALGQLGLPTVRHVASPATTPGYVLQLVAAAGSDVRALDLRCRRRERSACARCWMQPRPRRCSTGTSRPQRVGDAMRESSWAWKTRCSTDARC